MHSLAEQLLYTTVRLEGKTAKGMSVGTGFFFAHNNRLFIVTNKHVVRDVADGKFLIHEGRINGQERELVEGCGHWIKFESSNFMGHPDPSVDVAIMNVSTIINKIDQSGRPSFWKNITEDEFPTKEHYEKYIGPLEEILFIGYPNGIWDQKNIQPIARRGITATPCYQDFEGQKKFLIDASVFPGSSGSPVFIYYSGSHADKEGNLYAGNRWHFLGIIAEVAIKTEQGELKLVNVPTAQKAVVTVNQMIDLGIVFKAETIKECAEHFEHLLKANGIT